MLFHTPQFLVFFLVFSIGLLAFNGNARLAYVMIASYLFYAWWDPWPLVVLLGLTAYAHYVANAQILNQRTLILAISAAFIPLAVYKYLSFAVDNWNALGLWQIAFHSQWRLPLGISFITFTVVAYITDVHRGRLKAERNPLRTALYIAFFPHLIAGPILRASKVLPQLDNISIRWTVIRFALLLFTIGALKKVAVADQIAPFVDGAYRRIDILTQGEAIIAFYGFMIQIYCDFSGYTDMAFAIALLLGVRFPLNFRSPYTAGSFRDFWRRWHISLSQWLRDYVYIPLGGSRGTEARTICALLVTMLLGGLWHGAAWTFVAWGGIHGLLLAAEHIGKIICPPFPRPLRVIFVAHIVGALWILFRAPNLNAAEKFTAQLLTPGDLTAIVVNPVIILLIALAFALHRWDNAVFIRFIAKKIPLAVIAPVAISVIAICAALAAENPSAFIYFDF